MAFRWSVVFQGRVAVPGSKSRSLVLSVHRIWSVTDSRSRVKLARPSTLADLGETLIVNQILFPQHCIKCVPNTPTLSRQFFYLVWPSLNCYTLSRNPVHEAFQAEFLFNNIMLRTPYASPIGKPYNCNVCRPRIRE